MPGRELTLLTEGNIELLGLIPRSSNQTFLVRVSCGDDNGYAVYKPEAGERPLSDFEPGLYKRERAAYLLSESLGWGFVPPTVVRDEAPLGVGSLQWFIECDFQEHYFTLFEDAPETHRELAGSPCSTTSPTTPTARAAMCCAATTDGSGHRPRAMLLGGIQVADRDLGLRRRPDPRGPTRRHRPASRGGASRGQHRKAGDGGQRPGSALREARRELGSRLSTATFVKVSEHCATVGSTINSQGDKWSLQKNFQRWQQRCASSEM